MCIVYVRNMHFVGERSIYFLRRDDFALLKMPLDANMAGGWVPQIYYIIKGGCGLKKIGKHCLKAYLLITEI